MVEFNARFDKDFFRIIYVEENLLWHECVNLKYSKNVEFGSLSQDRICKESLGSYFSKFYTDKYFLRFSNTMHMG